MEQRIIQAAKQVFIEKGYAKAGMSDIAVRVGINRSGLHYYFRTKEKMFEAVFADIVLSFIPSIHNIILQDKPIPERIAEMVDVYFEVLRKEPCFPVFITQEIQRDATHLFNTISSLEIGQYASRIKEVLHTEMKNGTIKNIPIEFIFYTFYGLIVFPFLVRPEITPASGKSCRHGKSISSGRWNFCSFQPTNPNNQENCDMGHTEKTSSRKWPPHDLRTPILICSFLFSKKTCLHFGSPLYHSR